jgi:hypothetical protein
MDQGSSSSYVRIISHLGQVYQEKGALPNLLRKAWVEVLNRSADLKDVALLLYDSEGNQIYGLAQQQ